VWRLVGKSRPRTAVRYSRVGPRSDVRDTGGTVSLAVSSVGRVRCDVRLVVFRPRLRPGNRHRAVELKRLANTGRRSGKL
jgi:hypothetical protein